jgi:4-amino-4-deoxy-L-arabinose transferase-like glycosyltransferase
MGSVYFQRFFKDKPSNLLIIFLSALSLKLLIFFLVTEPIIFNKYPYFAERISNGLDIGERILDLSPLYLYVNVLIYKIYGKNWEVLAVLQILMGSLNCLFIYFIGEKIFGKAVGFVAALVLLLYGNLTLIELTLEPEVFGLFFNSLLVLILIPSQAETNTNSLNRLSSPTLPLPLEGGGLGGGKIATPYCVRINPGKGFGRMFSAGLLIGLATITKPNALLLLPVTLLWLWICPIYPSPGRKIKSMLFVLLGVALLISPITLRNYVKFQDFILITADSGKVFFHGNGPGSTGMERADLPDQGFAEESQSEPDSAHAFFRRTARALAGRPLKPSECSSFWFARTLNHMRAHPFSAFVLDIKKFFYFWGNYEVHDIDSTYKNYRTLRNWPLLPFGIISALGIVGMGLALKKFRQAFLLYAVILVYLISNLIFFVTSRYRLPAAPFLSIFSAYALTSLYTQWHERHLRKFLICSGLVVCLFASTHFLFRNEIEALDRWQIATRIHYGMGGNLLFKKGLYREAILEFEKAIALEPDFAPAYNRLGMSYAVLNDYGRAERYFRKVIELSPGIDQGYLNLGLLYELKGEPSKALPLLEKAFSLNPENPKTKEHLQKLRAAGAKG